MASVIKIKRNSTSGAVPSSLQEGELAVNLFDRKIYAGNSSGVTAIGGVSGFAADILTEIKTVDGTGSGLDADLLDGQHGAYYAVAATENSRLANTNAFIATKLDSSSYTTADVRSKAALANTNAYIATRASEADSLSRLANTNAYIASTLTSAQNLAGARLGATATVQISGDVAGSASFSGNTVNVAVTQQNNSVDLGTHTTGNYVATVSGTANEIEVSGSGSETAAVTIGLPDNVTIGNNLTVSGNTHIDGNLTVEGATTYLSTSTVYTDDGMMKLNANNVADAVDSGIYNKFVESATTKYAGYFRDATDGVFKFYNSLEVEPTTTVNTGAAGYTLAQLDAVIDGGTY
jgi:hypothetical protein